MIPQKFHEFLQSGCKKKRLIELLFEYIQLNNDEVLQNLISDTLVLSSDNNCVGVSRVAIMALIKNITSSVILNLTLKVQVPFLVFMFLQLINMCRRFSAKGKKCWKLMKKYQKFEETFGKVVKNES